MCVTVTSVEDKNYRKWPLRTDLDPKCPISNELSRQTASNEMKNFSKWGPP